MNVTVLILLLQTNSIEVHSFTNIWFNVYILTHVCVVAKKKSKAGHHILDVSEDDSSDEGKDKLKKRYAVH